MVFRLSILFVAFLFTCSQGLAQKKINYCQQASSMVETIVAHHYEPQLLDDQFSIKVFDDFVEMLDPQSRIFTHEDLGQINPFRTQIDDELKNKSCLLIPRTLEIYRKRLTHVKQLLTEILSKPLDFTTPDYIEFSMYSDTAYYAKNNEELTHRWQKWLKYQMLMQMLNNEADTTGEFSISWEKQFAKEAEIRSRLLQREICRIDKIIQHPMGFEPFVSSLLLQAIARSFDPHTNFFSAYDIRMFEASVSKDAYSYGLYLDENKDGDIIVSNIIPGSPAWQINTLQKGDIILNLETSDKKIQDFLCMDVYEASEFLQSTDQHEIKLTIKKANGQGVQTIRLKKAKMEMEENLVQSFILNGEKKIGFISLPGFYTQLEDDEMIGCANDVAREIIKMKKENIDGLILDLRYNGGGAMKEALELAGIFIDFGPVTIAKEKGGAPVVMKDMHRGAVYTGPMVVMVNTMSASASEIFAAAMQDYNRAVIVGSSTYGKATGQIVLPIEGGKSSPIHRSGEFVKVTIEKFFRLDGTTHQQTGVIPDVELPDFYAHLPVKEVHEKNVLSKEKIDKKTYYQELKPLPVTALSEKSTQRVKKNEQLQMVGKSDLSPLMKLHFRLIPVEFEQDSRKYLKIFAQLDDDSPKVTTHYTVENVGFNDQHIINDQFKSDYIKSFIDDIKQSIYIEEAYFIINDLISNQ